MKPVRCRVLGMTAIELLAATLLASLMLAAVAGVLGGLARQERVLRAKADVPYWHHQLTDQLLSDLRNARSIIASAAGVRLIGFAARDFASTRPTGQAATIDYYLVLATNDRWLVRREEHPDDLTNDAARTDVVCRSVDYVQWGAAKVDRVVAPAVGPQFAATDQSTAIPDCVAVAFWASNSNAPFFDRTLNVR